MGLVSLATRRGGGVGGGGVYKNANLVDICSPWKLLVGFVALRPKSTAMVIAGRSVHLTTLFPGQA